MRRTLARLAAALLVGSACSGCFPAGSFSRAPLPEVAPSEAARASADVQPMDQQRYTAALKRSFYRTWIAHYGPDVIPSTVRVYAPDPGAPPPTVEGMVTAFIEREGSTSPLALVKITSNQLEAVFRQRPGWYDDAAQLVARYQRPLDARLQRVGQRVAAAAGRPDLSFVLHPALGVNAYVPHELGADRVTVGAQLVLVAETDDELAAVLGHEVAHIVQGHAATGAARDAVIEGLETTTGAMVATVLAVASAGNRDPAARSGAIARTAGAASAGTGLAAYATVAATGYTRDAERDADYYGVQYAAAAGYAPAGAVSIFRKLMELEKGAGEDGSVPFFRDHPGTEERLVRVTKTVARLQGNRDLVAGVLRCWSVQTARGWCRTCCTSMSACATECD